MLRALATATLLAFAASPAAALEPGEVVVSIKPIHSLVAAVMEGVGTPQLIVKGAGSPHSYSLRPSEARALDAAKVVFLVSTERLETFLAGPLAALAGGAEVVELGEVPGIVALPPREAEAFEAHDHGEETGQAAEAGHGHGEADPHLWLDPKNAAAMATAIATTLAAADPAHAARYAANGERLQAHLAEETAKIDAMLAPVRGKPFIVFHDAYQYFEMRFDIAAAGAVTLNPQAQPGAKGIAHVRQRIAEVGAVCVFSEPQFEPRIVSVVIEASGARSGVLDPIGAALGEGPSLYFELLDSIAGSLVDCLSAR